jgi:peptidoglycan/LPS O-acetylase OafA/YrhL
LNEIRGLTGLRGIAAVIVFLAHTQETLLGRGLPLQVPTLVQRLFLSGGRQVDIFFVLSGFILALIYRDWFRERLAAPTYFKFLRRRVARIYPLHLFMLLLIMTFVYTAYALHIHTSTGLDKYTVASIPATALMIHAWGFLDSQGGPWNPPSWSISIEFLAYLLFPLFVWGTAGLGRSRPWTLLAVTAACGFALNIATRWGLAGFPGIARGLSEFAFGCATANFYGSAVATWMQGRPGSFLAALGLVVCFALLPDTGFICAVMTAPLLLALCGSNPVSRALSATPVYFLGEVSYSIYLGHFLYSTIAYRLIDPAWMLKGMPQMLAGLAGICVFVLLLSTATYYAIERPGRDLLGGRRAKYRAAAAASADPAA